MLGWHRDVYCGYRGFSSVQEVFESFPTYMVWDDDDLTGRGHSTNDNREIIPMRNGGSAYSGLVQLVAVPLATARRTTG